MQSEILFCVVCLFATLRESFATTGAQNLAVAVADECIKPLVEEMAKQCPQSSGVDLVCNHHPANSMAPNGMTLFAQLQCPQHEFDYADVSGTAIKEKVVQVCFPAFASQQKWIQANSAKLIGGAETAEYLFGIKKGLRWGIVSGALDKLCPAQPKELKKDAEGIRHFASLAELSSAVKAEILNEIAAMSADRRGDTFKRNARRSLYDQLNSETKTATSGSTNSNNNQAPAVKCSIGEK